MTELIKSLPEILKAVTDPFSLLALMVLVLGFIGYSVIRTSTIKSRQSALPGPVIALSIVAVSFLALAFNILRVTALQSGTTPNSISDKYTVQVVFSGKKAHAVATTVPFRTSSGQLNVGCGESASTTVSWNLPQGAREASVSASWENTDNIQNQSQQAMVSGNVATATGVVRGRDREWLGNCPGGGHGQLVLHGSYVIDQGGPEEDVVLKNYQDLLPPGGTVRIPIPLNSDVFPSLCKITAANAKNQFTMTITFRRDPNGQVAIAEIDRQQAGLDAAIQGGDLVLTLPKGK